MVNKIFATLLMLVFSTVAFSQKEFNSSGKAKAIERYTDGSIKAEGYYKDGVKKGKWTHYYENGTIQSTRYFNSKGDCNGKWTYWYADGQKWNTVKYNKGEVHGHWKYWYKNGNKWHQLSYTEGEVLGKWNFWREDGSRNESGRYTLATAGKG